MVHKRDYNAAMNIGVRCKQMLAVDKSSSISAFVPVGVNADSEDVSLEQISTEFT